MWTIEELRAEARRLLETVDVVPNPEVKRELAHRALELSQRAEALANGKVDPFIHQMNIDRYRSLLASGNLSDEQRRLVEEMLADAEALLRNPGAKAP